MTVHSIMILQVICFRSFMVLEEPHNYVYILIELLDYLGMLINYHDVWIQEIPKRGGVGCGQNNST